MIGCIIQARTKSSRFPRKIYEDINGQNTLQRVLKGVSQSKITERIILAMPDYDKEEFIQRVHEFDDCVDDRFRVYFGNADDVMDRYWCAAKENDIDLIVRICADSPLLPGSLVDEMLKYYKDNNITGFLGNIRINNDKDMYPPGFAVEIFPMWMLEDAMANTNEIRYREHVTPYMYRKDSTYQVAGFTNLAPHSVISYRFDNLSFDTAEDLEIIKKVAVGYDEHHDINRAILEA